MRWRRINRAVIVMNMSLKQRVAVPPSAVSISTPPDLKVQIRAQRLHPDEPLAPAAASGAFGVRVRLARLGYDA